MKNGTYATYQGKEYMAEKLWNGEFRIRSTDENDLQNGFQTNSLLMTGINTGPGMYIKKVKSNEIEEFYSLKTYANYLGYKFQVLSEKNNQLSIVTIGGDYREWERLGMNKIDKLTYRMWIDKEQAEVFVEKTELSKE